MPKITQTRTQNQTTANHWKASLPSFRNYSVQSNRIRRLFYFIHLISFPFCFSFPGTFSQSNPLGLLSLEPLSKVRLSTSLLPSCTYTLFRLCSCFWDLGLLCRASLTPTEWTLVAGPSEVATSGGLIGFLLQIPYLMSDLGDRGFLMRDFPEQVVRVVCHYFLHGLLR